nr:MAG: hypothetical protein [Caudoviricetes sp.]
MLSFTQFLQQLEEALTASQQKKVNTWVRSLKGNLPARRITGHLPFNENDRLTIPVEQAPQEANKRHVSPEIESHLKSKGFTPVSSTHAEREIETTIPEGPRKGEVVKKKQQQKIGALLSDNPELQKQHAKSEALAGSKSKNLKIIITRNPTDVAGQSTGRSWTSCKAMADPDSNDLGGCNQQYVEKDVKKSGTHMAYLVRHDDDNIENPIARIALNPHVSASGNHTILRVPTTSKTSNEVKQYGQGGADFAHTVRQWAETNTPKNANEPYYQIHPDAYDDTNLNDPNTRSIEFNHNLNSEGIHKIIKTGSPEVVKGIMKNNPNITQEHVNAAINHPNPLIQVHGLEHPLAPPEALDNTMNNSMDFRKHEAVMRNPNASDENVRKGLFHFHSQVRGVAARHKKAKREHLQQVSQEPNLDPYVAKQVNDRLKRMDAAEKILAMRQR